MALFRLYEVIIVTQSKILTIRMEFGQRLKFALCRKLIKDLKGVINIPLINTTFYTNRHQLIRQLVHIYNLYDLPFGKSGMACSGYG